MNVAILGAGYVGCVSAACLASLGHRVWLVEVAPEKLRLLREAGTPVAEPGLDDLLGRALQAGQVMPLDDAAEAVRRTELALVCVGTPSRPDGSTETSHVRRVLEQLASALDGRSTPYVVALRSSVPYAQVDAELLPVLSAGPLAARWGREVLFALNPEFLREGSAVEDFLAPPFVVIGTEHPEAATTLRELYEGIPAPVHILSPGSASLLKYACNAFHGLKVTFANEIAALAPAFAADARAVMQLLCEDRVLNISSAYLRPGYAFGGSCLPKDLRALTRMAVVHGVAVPLLSSILASNAAVISRSVELLRHLPERSIGLVGLSFKAGTDDLRESPLVELAERLVGKGFDLRIFDPEVRLEMLQGRNLQYVRQHLPHLANLLVDRVQDLFTPGTANGQVVVLGKPLIGPERLRELVPPGTRVVDLARCLPAEFEALQVFRV